MEDDTCDGSPDFGDSHCVFLLSLVAAVKGRSLLPLGSPVCYRSQARSG
jgi:hypothetical protein